MSIEEARDIIENVFEEQFQLEEDGEVDDDSDIQNRADEVLNERFDIIRIFAVNASTDRI